MNSTQPQPHQREPTRSALTIMLVDDDDEDEREVKQPARLHLRQRRALAAAAGGRCSVERRTRVVLALDSIARARARDAGCRADCDRRPFRLHVCFCRPREHGGDRSAGDARVVHPGCFQRDPTWSALGPVLRRCTLRVRKLGKGRAGSAQPGVARGARHSRTWRAQPRHQGRDVS
jgi:hypothetical protein